MPEHHFIRSFIISAGDGDRCGLHELLSTIGPRLPKISTEELRQTCQQACLELLEAHHAVFEMTPAHADRPGRGGYTAISLDDARTILDAKISWQTPIDSNPRYWLMATEAGKAEYISSETLSL